MTEVETCKMLVEMLLRAAEVSEAGPVLDETIFAKPLNTARGIGLAYSSSHRPRRSAVTRRLKS